MGYYRGDFYRGDPGFFSFLGRLGKGVVSAVTGVNIGGGKVPSPSAPAALPIGHGFGSASMGRIGARAAAIVKMHPVLAAAGTAALGGLGITALARRGGAPTMAAAAAGEVPKGYHVSKRTGAVVRNRHMHVTNPRALRRAIRRAHGFAKLARKVMRFTSPRPPKGRGFFKVRRKKK